MPISHHTPTVRQLVTIRTATRRDVSAVHTLEHLDEQSLPTGEALIAEHDGRAVAAVHVATGAAVADPFTRSSDSVALLRLRAAQQRRARR